MNFKVPLSVKFFGLFALLLIAVMAASTVVITNQVSLRIKNQIYWRAISLAKFLSSQAAEALLQGDDLTLVSITTGVKRSNPGVLRAVVLDNRGILVSHSDSILLKDKPYKLRGIKINRSLTDDLYGKKIKVSLFESGNSIGVELPMIDRIEGKKLGNVYVFLSKGDIEEAAKNTRKLLALISLLAVIGGIVISWFFSWLITRNIQVLLHDLEEIGKGDLEHEVRAKSNDEIGVIADAIRKMAYQLKQAQERLIESEKLKHEIEVAQRIQSILLPRSMPRIQGYEFSATYLPALIVGGDYYDYFRMLGNQWGFLVADVSGKGVGGSLVMVMFRTVIHSEAPISSSVKELILRAHTSIVGEIPDDMYVTCGMVQLNPSSNAVSFASAGHNPPLYYSFKKGKAYYLEVEGAPVGLAMLTKEDLERVLVEQTLTLEPGDTVILYSDGITEAMNSKGEMFGEERLKEKFESLAGSGASAEKIKEGLIEEVKEFTQGTPQSDDITLLVIRKI